MNKTWTDLLLMTKKLFHVASGKKTNMSELKTTTGIYIDSLKKRIVKAENDLRLMKIRIGHLKEEIRIMKNKFEGKPNDIRKNKRRSDG